MKISEALYNIPDMSEEKLLEEIDKYKNLIYKEWFRNKYTSKEILSEWDLINSKQSKLSRSQRDAISGLVGYCLIKMTKNNEN